MLVVLWDSSALIKRFAPETGHATVDALFRLASPFERRSTYWVYAEVYSILIRKRNDGRISMSDFSEAISALYREVLMSDDFDLLSIDDETVLNSIPIIVQHNLNSADAAILTAFLEYARELPAEKTCVLLTSDRRLIRAAQQEGLTVLNPEAVSPTDLPSFLASL